MYISLVIVLGVSLIKLRVERFAQEQKSLHLRLLRPRTHVFVWCRWMVSSAFYWNIILLTSLKALKPSLTSTNVIYRLKWCLSLPLSASTEQRMIVRYHQTSIDWKSRRLSSGLYEVLLDRLMTEMPRHVIATVIRESSQRRSSALCSRPG